MRVLTVGNIHPPHHLGGGYELDWAAGVAALQAAGHDVRVLTTDLRRADVVEPDPPWVFRELRWYWHEHEFPRRRLRERLSIERRNAAVVAGQLREFAPELVSWWSMGGMSLAPIEQVRRAGVPALGVVYDDWMVYGPRVDAWQALWGRAALRPAASLASAAGAPAPVRLGPAARWLFCSESVRSAARGAVSDLVDTGLLAPGLDEVFLAPAPPREWQGVLLLPGRLDARKGIATAIEALAHMPGARLRLVGGGDDSYAAELRALAELRGVAGRLELLPPRPRAELAAAYAEADAVLFPVEWAEPFGLVPLEAMGIGRPVVATGRGGSGEYLRDGENCLLHEPGDARGLAAAVQKLAADPGLRERLRDGGFETAPAFARSKWDARLVAEHVERRRAA
jgi:glycosyltransferase involved in cell wall biosynthesis